MRFDLDDEQQELRSIARRFLAAESPTSVVRQVVEQAPGHDPRVWSHLGELGLLGLAVPEEHGGAGASAVEVAVLLREAGRVLLPSPLLTHSVAAAALVAAGGEPAARWLPALAAGSSVATVATASPAGVDDLDAPGVLARRDGAGWRLDGEKGFVVGGGLADLLLVTATTPDGPQLFAVGVQDLVRAVVPALDPTRSLASVVFTATPATPLGLDRAGIEGVLLLGAVWLANEQVGGAERCLELAVDHARTRVQFDRPIGSFQAVKHLLADVLLEVEAARAAADYAVLAAASGSTDFPFSASVAKSVCSDTYVQAAGVNLQVHGGMGFTWEHDAHLHLKRARGGRELFGSPDRHRELLAAARL